MPGSVRAFPVTPKVRGHDVARLRQQREQCFAMLTAARAAMKHHYRRVPPAPLVGEPDTIAVMKNGHRPPFGKPPRTASGVPATAQCR